jgi:hypothetical protein
MIFRDVLFTRLALVNVERYYYIGNIIFIERFGIAKELELRYDSLADLAKDISRLDHQLLGI